MSTKFLQELKTDIRPDIECYKIGPEVVEGFLGKLLVMMGSDPRDILSIIIGNEKKKLRLVALVKKDSGLFAKAEPAKALALLGTVGDELRLSDQAVKVLKGVGFSYIDTENEKTVKLYNVTEYKKNVEIEFNAEVAMAIITDTDYMDQYFNVYATEEVVRRKKDEKKKFKGKKRTVVFARIEKAFNADGGYNPSQVEDWGNGKRPDGDDEDDEPED